MAEEENVAEVENKEPVQNEPVVVTEVPKKSRSGLIFGVINLMLILLLAGFGFFMLQDLKDKQLTLKDSINKDSLREIEADKQLNTYQSQLGTMQSQIATFSEEIAGKDNHFTKTLADFSKLHTERLETVKRDLTMEVNQLKRQLGKTRSDWLLADAEYLLSVANQRLQLVGDVTTSRMALEAADERLRESGDAAAYKVREQIAKEIAGLNNIKLPDMVAVYASIQLLKDKIDTLAVLLPYAGKPLTPSKQVHDHQKAQDGDHGLLGSALHMLEGYVTVKHADQPVTTIITEEEVGFIRQQLSVKLEMIKLALVQQNDALFKAGIQDAKTWLDQNFTRNTYFKQFDAELDKLNTLPIRSQFPDISRSLKMLKDITKLRLDSDKAMENSAPTPTPASVSATTEPASEQTTP